MNASRHALADWLSHIERVHFRSIDLTLDRVRRVAHALRLPARARHVVVAGTNGKGSSVAYLESIYRLAGYRTAAYTSPHLVRYNERVRIDGVPVDDAPLEAAFERVERARGEIPLTYFEFGTLAALCVFADASPDVVILEVGMGGRLDAVNIVDGDVALITEVGLDHQQWLGDTVEKIAREKAGILRHGGRAVGAGTRPPRVLAEIAAARRCEMWQYGVDYRTVVEGARWHWTGPARGRSKRGDRATITDLPVPRGGQHQLANAAGAVAVVGQVNDFLPVADRQLAEGIRDASMPGRLQRVEANPPLLFDVAHNVDGLAVLSRWLRDNRPQGRIVGVFSMLADKDIVASVRQVADLVDHWHVAPLDNPRAADVDTLATAIRRESSAPLTPAASVQAAADAAVKDAGADDLVVVFGSFYAVGDIMRHLRLDPYSAPR